jgi:hypothetical protein
MSLALLMRSCKANPNVVTGLLGERDRVIMRAMSRNCADVGLQGLKAFSELAMIEKDTCFRVNVTLFTGNAL